ncbi:MAG TPA: SdrD B-like domain-containing protein [Patescibacteria group bacterium]|nr:SdrD B-like domain-containing protein [Patescibacteria group bacterium]
MGGKVTNSETGGAIGGVVIASNIGSATTDGNGNYREGGFGYLQSFSFNPPNSNTPCNNGYICNGAGAGSPNPALISGTVGGSGDCGTNCNFTYTPGHIGGHVYVDYSHDGTYNASEDTPIAGVAVTSTNPSSGNKTVTTDTNGYFDISYLDDGSHTVTIPNTFTDGNGHKYVGVVTSHTVTIGPNNYSQIFLITPLYEISGVIYNDIDKNQYYLLPAGSGDTPYTSGSSGVSIVGIDSATSTRSDGTFDSGVALRSGQYTITYSTLPANYKMTYPIGSTPPQLTVWIGTPGKSIACNNNGVHNAQCDAWGDIVGNTSQTTGVDFGITNEYSHTGGFCTDVRDENTIQDFIPNNPTCGVMSGAYVIYGNISCVPNPSVYYSGSTTVDFGYGKPNANNWLIGGATSENFSPVNPGSYRTSYSYINSTIVNGNIPTVDLSTVCTLTNCYLPDNLPDAIYKASSTVSFNGTYNTSTNTNVAGTYTFPLNKSYVFLVNGDINFYSKMLVPNGSTATFSDSGNINVEPNVGETSVTSTMGDLEGFYSADNSFNILSSYIDTTRCNPDGTTKDLRFNLIGSAVANVGGAGGTFNNMRDLCVSDLQCPAVTGGTGDGGDNGGGSGGPTGGGSGSTTGTDLGLTYILNAPDVIKHPNFFWQELTP